LKRHQKKTSTQLKISVSSTELRIISTFLYLEVLVVLVA
jgi:hypothetical protein